MDLDSLILNESMGLNLDPHLIKAFILVESGGNPWAVRFEPRWKYFYFARGYADNLGITFETEQTLQACSYGLMQVMGSVARELGFKDNLLKLTDPVTALHYGCLKLKSLYNRYQDEADIIAAYNAGSAKKTSGGMYFNMLYVDKVSAKLRDLRALTT